MKLEKKEKKIEDEEILEGNKEVITETNFVEEELKNQIKDSKKSFIKNNKKGVVALICIAILVLLALVLSTIFSIININNTKIISGVKVNGIEISKLSKEEAIQKLNEIFTQKLENDILLKSGDFEYGIKLSQIETSYNIEKAIEEAYNIGRSGNIFSNNYEILKSKLMGKDINLEYTYNEELLNKIVNDMNSKVPNPVTEPDYCIEDDKLIITKGMKGNSINIEQVKQIIKSEILNNNNGIQIEVELIEKEPEPINIDEIYAKVHTEAKDAYYTKDPFQIYPHINGIDFDLEAAREMLKEDKNEYEIDLKITVPKITTDKIGPEAFPDLLSSFSTRYDASNYPRTTNLKLAMNKLNGVVVASGETFSYNKTLGKRTAAAGYKEAGGYAAGGVVQTLAGGICQISSTLYDAVVYANLDIVERHNHMFLAGYVGAGKDATVVYGALDFKFKNTRKYPIMIKTSIGNGIAKIDIYGIKEDVEYDVDIVTSILSYTPFKVIYENDNSLEEGQQKVTQNGMNGCKSITYKVVKLNGTEVSRTVLSSDTYDPMNKIIKVGPKKETNDSTNNSSATTTTTKPSTTNPSTPPPSTTTPSAKPPESNGTTTESGSGSTTTTPVTPPANGGTEGAGSSESTTTTENP